MADELLETFATTYKSGSSDIDMKSERFAKFSMKRERSPDDPDGGANVEGDINADVANSTAAVSFMESAMDMLTGNLRKRRRSGYYNYRYIAQDIITCR